MGVSQVVIFEPKQKGNLNPNKKEKLNPNKKERAQFRKLIWCRGEYPRIRKAVEGPFFRFETVCVLVRPGQRCFLFLVFLGKRKRERKGKKKGGERKKREEKRRKRKRKEKRQRQQQEQRHNLSCMTTNFARINLKARRNGEKGEDARTRQTREEEERKKS